MDTRLKEWLRFDDNDLDANRKLVFSVKQQNDLRAEKINDIKLFLWALLVEKVFLAILLSLNPFGKSYTIYCLLPILVVGWVVVESFRTLLKRRHHCVQKAEGYIHIKSHSYPDWDEDGYKHSYVNSYSINVENKSFSVDRESWGVLECITEGDICAVYYDLEHDGKILSIEFLSKAS